MTGNLFFSDETKKKQIEKDGFFATSFLNENEVRALIRLYQTNVDERGKPDYFTTHKDCSISVRLKLHYAILEICKSKIDSILSNYEVVIAMYFVKKTGAGSEIGLHIDPSMTIEGYNHMGFWVPLVDIEETTGQICFLRGSQHLCKPYHSLSIPSPYSNIRELIYPALDCMSVKAGDAVIFDNNTLHCSMPNVSGRSRLALVIKIIDKNAPLVSAFLDKNKKTNTIDLYEHERDYYLTEYWQENEPPARSKYLKTIDNPHQEFEEQFFRDFINARKS